MAANCHLEPSEINNFPAPVAFDVVPIEPFGAVVTVELAVMAVDKKYKPATPLETAALPVDVKDVDTTPAILETPAVIVPAVRLPVTTALSS